MRINARNLFYDAYRTLGVLRSGQQTSDDAMDDALRSCNDMIDAWALERLMVYSIEPASYTLTGLPSYTLGPGGTLGTVRPQRIESAGILYPGASMETPLTVLTLDEYRAHGSGVYVDSSYPVANVYVYPASSGTLVLYGWVPFSGFTSVDSVVDLPAGYARALRWNLALELVPMARIAAKIPDVLYQNIQAQAAESKGWVKSFNSRGAMPEMKTGLGCNSYYAFCTDTYC